jgi:hypothetical protein
MKRAGPATHRRWLARFLSALDLLILVQDLAYTFVWTPGLVLALTGGKLPLFPDACSSKSNRTGQGPRAAAA